MRAGVLKRFFNQVINGANGFTQLAVGNQYAKAVRFQGGVNFRLHRARMIRNNNVFLGHVSSHDTVMDGAETFSSLPSFQPSRFLAVNTAKDEE